MNRTGRSVFPSSKYSR